MNPKTLFLIVIIFISGCKKKENSESGPSGVTNSSITPLKNGNTWTYRDITLPQQDTMNLTHWISGDTMIGSELWFREYVASDSSNYIYTKNKSDGQHYYIQPDDIDYLIYKYPATVGDIYYVDNGLDTLQVLNTDTSITVPAGTFSCYEYKEFSLSAYYALYFVSPGNGFIKSMNFSNGNLHSTTELISYHLE